MGKESTPATPTPGISATLPLYLAPTQPWIHCSAKRILVAKVRGNFSSFLQEGERETMSYGNSSSCSLPLAGKQVSVPYVVPTLHKSHFLGWKVDCYVRGKYAWWRNWELWSIVSLYCAARILFAERYSRLRVYITGAYPAVLNTLSHSCLFQH